MSAWSARSSSSSRTPQSDVVRLLPPAEPRERASSHRARRLQGHRRGYTRHPEHRSPDALRRRIPARAGGRAEAVHASDQAGRRSRASHARLRRCAGRSLPVQPDGRAQGGRTRRVGRRGEGCARGPHQERRHEERARQHPARQPRRSPARHGRRRCRHQRHHPGHVGARFVSPRPRPREVDARRVPPVPHRLHLGRLPAPEGARPGPCRRSERLGEDAREARRAGLARRRVGRAPRGAADRRPRS